MELEYDPAYHLNCRLDLLSGRTVALESLRQWRTYSGMLEGMPTKRFNDRFIESAVHKAQADCVHGAQPLLLPPRRRAYLRKPGDMESARTFLRREPEWLPVVTCIAVFSGVFPATERGKDLSFLTVVWYQDQFALPISPEIVEQLRSLDWDQCSTDVVW